MFPALLALSLSGTVTKIVDGDTIHAVVSHQKAVIRLNCIDSPEKKAPGGLAAMLSLGQVLTIGQEVKLESSGSDRYGRMTALVYSSNRLVNLEQVQSGHAVIYPHYFTACKQRQQEFTSAQEDAQKKQLGFWSLPISEQIMPWNWRKLKK